MKKNYSMNFFSLDKKQLILLLIILFLYTQINTQPTCKSLRIPQRIPIQVGQQPIINLEQYFIGTNLTYSVQPNNNFSNIKQQYTCKNKWEHMIGNIIMTKMYKPDSKKKQQFLAMLGQSTSVEDLYHVYYQINKNFTQSMILQNQSNLNENEVEVIDIPRGIVKKCMSFAVHSNITHIEFIIDCISQKNPSNKIFGYVKFALTKQPPKQYKWQFIQSQMYVPPLVKKSAQCQIQLFSIKNQQYLVRMMKGQFGYLQLWRWDQQKQTKQIINFYDKDFFLVNGIIAKEQINLHSWQIDGKSLIILDYFNGIHLIELNKIGKLQYKVNLNFEFYSTFYFDITQQILYMGKRGLIQQYQITVLPSSLIDIQRIQRYHLFGFQDLRQISGNGQFLYALSNNYIHTIHLTNIDFNNQQYDGAYNIYPGLFCNFLLPSAKGVIKLINFNSEVRFEECQIHPPVLHLKAPSNASRIVVNAESLMNNYKVTCFFVIQIQQVIFNDQSIYGYGNSQNQTLFTNRPGRTILMLDKFGFGKNLEYQVILINHQINFTHQIKKINTQQCYIGAFHSQNNQKLITKNSQNNEIFSSKSIGNWLIVTYNEKTQKQYYQCNKYFKLQCYLISMYNTGYFQLLEAHQIYIDQKTGKNILIQASAFLSDDTYGIQINFIQNLKNNNKKRNNKENQNQSFSIVKRSCIITYPKGIQYQITEMKIQDDRLFVLHKYLKQIRIYSAIYAPLSDQCLYYGSINATAFHNKYFAPRAFSFDKHTLEESIYTVQSSFSSFKRHSYKSLNSFNQLYVETIFIAQFNEVLILKLIFDSKSIQKIQLIQDFVVPFVSNNIQLVISMPYMLAVDKQKRYIYQYYLSHSWNIYYIRYYQNSMQGQVKLIDQTTIATIVSKKSGEQRYVQIYKLNSIVSTFKEYTIWQLNSKFFNVFTFKQNQYEFLQVLLQPSKSQLSCVSNILYSQAYLDVYINRKKSYEPIKQQFYIRVSTIQNSQRHIVSLQVANEAGLIQKGSRYPYSVYGLNFKDDSQSKYFQINDNKWFEGNIFHHRYLCNDCKNERINFLDKIMQIDKIQFEYDHKPDEFYVKKIPFAHDQFEFQIISGYLLTSIKHQKVAPWLPQSISMNIQQLNITQQQYLFSDTTILSSSTTQDQQCIKSNPKQHQFFTVSLCQKHQTFSNVAQLQIKVHSKTGFKSFVISQYLLQVKNIFVQNKLGLSINTQKQLILIDDLIVIRYFNNIFLFVFDQSQRIILIDTIDKMDLNGQNLCWVQIMKKNITKDSGKLNNNDNQNYYAMIASLCETGIYHMVFTINQPYVNYSQDKNKQYKQFDYQYIPQFRLILQQTIDLHTQLLYSKISLPQQSFFLQSIIEPSKNPNSELKQFYLYTFVQNFNSFIWKIQLGQNGIPILKCILEGVIKRYNQYSPIQVATNDQYFSVLYKNMDGGEQNLKEFVAVYDKQQFVIQDDFTKNYYFFQAKLTNISSIQSNKKSYINQIGNQMFLLNGNKLAIYNTLNMIRVNVSKTLKNNDTKMIQEIKFQQLKNNSNNLISQQNYNNEYILKQDPQLYTQNIIVFVQTLTEVNSVTLKLYSIDKIQLSGWQIFWIVFIGIIILVIGYFSIKSAWKWYQKKKRLVRLTADRQQENSSDVSDKSNEDKKQINRVSQITTSDNPLGQSLLLQNDQIQQAKD